MAQNTESERLRIEWRAEGQMVAYVFDENGSDVEADHGEVWEVLLVRRTQNDGSGADMGIPDGS